MKKTFLLFLTAIIAVNFYSCSDDKESGKGSKISLTSFNNVLTADYLATSNITAGSNTRSEGSIPIGVAVKGNIIEAIDVSISGATTAQVGEWEAADVIKLNDNYILFPSRAAPYYAAAYLLRLSDNKIFEIEPSTVSYIEHSAPMDRQILFGFSPLDDTGNLGYFRSATSIYYRHYRNNNNLYRMILPTNGEPQIEEIANISASSVLYINSKDEIFYRLNNESYIYNANTKSSVKLYNIYSYAVYNENTSYWYAAHRIGMRHIMVTVCTE